MTSVPVSEWFNITTIPLCPYLTLNTQASGRLDRRLLNPFHLVQDATCTLNHDVYCETKN